MKPPWQIWLPIFAYPVGLLIVFAWPPVGRLWDSFRDGAPFSLCYMTPLAWAVAGGVSLLLARWAKGGPRPRVGVGVALGFVTLVSGLAIVRGVVRTYRAAATLSDADASLVIEVGLNETLRTAIPIAACLIVTTLIAWRAVARAASQTWSNS